MGNELQVMRLNIAICDDEKINREQIKELAEKEMLGVCVGLYETGDALLAAGKQFDSRVHTGNAVSDAVVGSKFRYAAKKVKGIKLDAREMQQRSRCLRYAVMPMTRESEQAARSGVGRP